MVYSSCDAVPAVREVEKRVDRKKLQTKVFEEETE